jgi:hypothetical protein
MWAPCPGSHRSAERRMAPCKPFTQEEVDFCSVAQEARSAYNVDSGPGCRTTGSSCRMPEIVSKSEVQKVAEGEAPVLGLVSGASIS